MSEPIFLSVPGVFFFRTTIRPFLHFGAVDFTRPRNFLPSRSRVIVDECAIGGGGVDSLGLGLGLDGEGVGLAELGLGLGLAELRLGLGLGLAELRLGLGLAELGLSLGLADSVSSMIGI